jgi:catechol 2,3-dioxygenase-like lactoylglutathione lyase family enzyme
MTRIHHLALRTRDVEGLVRFYREWFGLEVVRDQSPRAQWLGLGEGAVLMIEAAEPGEPAIAAGSRELIAFHTDSQALADLRARLVAEGRLEAETAYTVYFRDPDGRRVGASCYPL